MMPLSALFVVSKYGVDKALPYICAKYFSMHFDTFMVSFFPFIFGGGWGRGLMNRGNWFGKQNFDPKRANSNSP